MKCINYNHPIVNFLLILTFVILLIMAIVLLLITYICDNQACKPFNEAFQQPTKKKIMLKLLDNLAEDGIWPYAYISSSILAAIFFSTLPIQLTVKLFALAFLLTFIVFYAIMGFFIHHYIKPIKRYIMDYINENIED
jgi:hypothetical protein